MAACAAAVCLALACPHAGALPLLTVREEIGGLIVYPDEKDARVFYYVPGRVTLATTLGVPNFSFRRMRYTGTKLMGDQGTFRGRGSLSFTVEFENIGAKVRAAEGVLKRRHRRAILKPIPVEKVEAELVYTIIEDDSSKRGEPIASGIWADPPKEPPTHGPSAGRWASKTFEIVLNPRTTQVMWEAYEKRGVLLSLNYAVVARGVSDLEQLPLEAQRRLEKLRRQVEADSGKDGSEDSGESFEPDEIQLDEIARTVLADALQISVFPGEHPECFTSVDLDLKMPAGYVFLDVYCYDFQSDPQTGIARKRVEIRAYGIAGGRPKVKVYFRRKTPDITSQSVRFDLAVDLNKGYEYRIVTFDTDGNTEKTGWTAVTTWSGTLDISTEYDLDPPPGEASTDEDMSTETSTNER